MLDWGQQTSQPEELQLSAVDWFGFTVTRFKCALEIECLNVFSKVCQLQSYCSYYCMFLKQSNILLHHFPPNCPSASHGYKQHVSSICLSLFLQLWACFITTETCNEVILIFWIHGVVAPYSLWLNPLGPAQITTGISLFSRAISCISPVFISYISLSFQPLLYVRRWHQEIPIGDWLNQQKNTLSHSNLSWKTTTHTLACTYKDTVWCQFSGIQSRQTAAVWGTDSAVACAADSMGEHMWVYVWKRIWVTARLEQAVRLSIKISPGQLAVEQSDLHIK